LYWDTFFPFQSRYKNREMVVVKKITYLGFKLQKNRGMKEQKIVRKGRYDNEKYVAHWEKDWFQKKDLTS
jgi:hypothetical protein